jgi:zinc D-Ala-D-Ala carboxypeptidase
MKLGKYFSLSEMVKSQTAIRKGIDNLPNDEQIEALIELVENVLDPVREHFGRPVTVNSGFRGKKLNKAIGGSKSSQHCKGEAADIEIPGVSNPEVAEWIKNNLDFDQLILEFHTSGIPDSGWVHVSWRSSKKNRKQVLTLDKTGTRKDLHY